MNLRELTDKELTELERLQADYKSATLAVAKSLYFGNPPEPASVALFTEAHNNVSVIIGRIKDILGVD